MAPDLYHKPKSAAEVEGDTSALKQVEAALQWARKSAEAAKRAQSELLSNMTHEMRTPMHAIMGMLDLALETPLDETQREYLLTAKKSAGLMLHLINDVFDYSKIESGKMELEETAFHLSNLVESVMKPLVSQTHEKSIEISWSISPECPRVLVGDSRCLRQVLAHVVGNALKFTVKGWVSLEIFPESRTSEEISLHFCITDSGIGIEKDRMEEIFQPFVQLDGSITRKHGGVGLGLSISKALVELMGGRLWCQSRHKAGTVFHFTAQFKWASESEMTSDETMDSDQSSENHPTALSRLVPLDLPHSSLIFNFQRGIQSSGGRVEKLTLTIEGFIAYAPALIEALKETAGAGENSLLEQTAADLREAAAHVGAGKLADEIFRFQLAVRRGDISSFDMLRNNIEKAFDAFKETISGRDWQEQLSETPEEAQ